MPFARSARVDGARILGEAVDEDVDDIGLHPVGVDEARIDRGDAAREAPRALMVARVHGVRVCERDERRAAITPAWRMPPPRSFAARRARTITARSPARMAPTGAPSPLHSAIETVSA